MISVGGATWWLCWAPLLTPPWGAYGYLVLTLGAPEIPDWPPGVSAQRTWTAVTSWS